MLVATGRRQHEAKIWTLAKSTWGRVKQKNKTKSLQRAQGSPEHTALTQLTPLQAQGSSGYHKKATALSPDNTH